MGYDPDRHHRQSIRLRGYDYRRDGIYFITLCVLGRTSLFGDITDDRMCLNDVGAIIEESWQWLGRQYGYVELGAWVIMPNHFHGILVLRDSIQTLSAQDQQMTDVGRPGGSPAEDGRPGGASAGDGGPGGSRTAPTGAGGNGKRRKSLGGLVGAFKTVSTKKVNQHLDLQGTPFWQRNFYDRIVRTERELQFIEDYISRNPATWNTDQLHPANPSKW